MVCQVELEVAADARLRAGLCFPGRCALQAAVHAIRESRLHLCIEPDIRLELFVEQRPRFVYDWVMLATASGMVRPFVADASRGNLAAGCHSL